MIKNKIYSSGSSGIAIKYYSTKNTVDQNKLDKSKKHGIQVYSHSSALITKSNIYRSSENGVSISSYSNHSTVLSNTIKYSGNMEFLYQSIQAQTRLVKIQ
ncbi:right-handed parallel beta-helix repeat-containing protein [Neobacillus niacini]|uniref:right-handed parallel beta-helix repeat-containing protein n=1 Tax=Neobacillus niacini TaxID=86668 RepID=UPI00285E1FBF|nr:right-handed parallel beta-helix repeat-containing protein [Neobacillus niacini]MDR7002386.1 isocitrate dehydrogenase [Neobacillus niacini]